MENFSIIIPVYNEEDNISNLIIEIYKVLKKYKNKFEIIVVDDNSTDNTYNKLISNKDKYQIKYLHNLKNKGQSFSIHYGIRESKFSTIITIDGDGQNNPINIIDLLQKYNSSFYQLLYGVRINRKDNLIKKISSKIANKIRSFILRDNCIDTGCSLKIFDKNVFLQIPYFNGMHRFLPALFLALGAKIAPLSVDHRYRKFGISKYGTIDRLYKGIIDLFKVLKIIKTLKKSDGRLSK